MMKLSIINNKASLNGEELHRWQKIVTLILTYLLMTTIVSAGILLTLAVMGVTTIFFIPVIIAVLITVGILFLMFKIL